MASTYRHRHFFHLLAGVTILLGLLVRASFMPFPPAFSKFVGDALWASLVYFLIASTLRHAKILLLSTLALGIAFAVECSQLYHAPWIDSLRTIPLVHMVIGTTFNPPDFLAYLIGVTLAASLDAAIHRHS